MSLGYAFCCRSRCPGTISKSCSTCRRPISGRRTGQIYRTLKELEHDGFIEISGFEQDIGPSKKLYAIMEKGREALHSWLLNPTQSDFITHSPFLMQLFFAGALTRDELFEFISVQLEQNSSLLGKLRENYIGNKKVFTEITGIQRDDPRFESAVWTHRWGVLSCESYSLVLEEMRVEILSKSDA